MYLKSNKAETDMDLWPQSKINAFMPGQSKLIFG